MDVGALRTLRAVQSQGGVTAAAAVLHLTPSAVSQQLAGLTREAGVPLTERVGRGVRLTAAGEALAEAALDVGVALERARAACGRFLDRPEGTVAVSAFQSGAKLLFPGLLARVAALEGVTLECSDEDVATDAFAGLTDRVDIVVAHRLDGGPAWPGEQSGGTSGEGRSALRVVPLLHEPLDVAVARDSPLAGRERVHPGDLVGQDWIAVHAGFPIAPVLDAVAAGSGSPPRIVHRINDFTVVEALVAGGHGIALLPRYTGGGHPGVRLLPLAGVRAGRRVDALLRPDRAERLVVGRVLDELVAEAGRSAAS